MSLGYIRIYAHGATTNQGNIFATAELSHFGTFN